MRFVADLAESIAGVIKASASPLGIFALMILVVGFWLGDSLLANR